MIDKGGQMQGASTEHDPFLIDRRRLLALEAAKDGAYAERDSLVALVSSIYPSWLGRHPDEDANWEAEWRNIVYVETPAGQLSWHIHDRELPEFSHLRPGSGLWDGHDSGTKYERIRALVAANVRPKFSMSVHLSRSAKPGKCDGCGRRRMLFLLAAQGSTRTVGVDPSLCADCAGLRSRA